MIKNNPIFNLVNLFCKTQLNILLVFSFTIFPFLTNVDAQTFTRLSEGEIFF